MFPIYGLTAIKTHLYFLVMNQLFNKCMHLLAICIQFKNEHKQEKTYKR